MRVISSDGTINVPYETSAFFIIQDDESKNYSICIRNANLTGYMQLATYPTFEDARSDFDDMIAADINMFADVFYLNKVKN